jgi:hypothetical protein
VAMRPGMLESTRYPECADVAGSHSLAPLGTPSQYDGARKQHAIAFIG